MHEVMITEDDARNALELDDRFIIEPSLVFWDRSDTTMRGVPVADGFYYASDNNPDILDAQGLKAMLREAGLFDENGQDGAFR